MASERGKLTLLEHAREARQSHESTSMWDSPKLDLINPARWYGLTWDEFSKEVTSDDPIVIECRKYINGETMSDFTVPEDEVKYVKEVEIPAWLEQPYQNDRRPIAELKLIHKFQPHLLRTPFDLETFGIINNKFGLPDVTSYHVSTFTGACGRFISKDSRSVIFVCKRTFAPDTVSTVVRHDFETATTIGYLFSDKNLPIHYALLEIPIHFRSITHPLLVPILTGVQMLEEATFGAVYVNDMLADIEGSTGFHDWDSVRSGTDAGHHGDYRALSRDLGRTASKFALLKSSILSIRAMHEFLSRELKSYRSWIPEENWKDYSESTKTLNERLDYMASHIEYLLLYRGIETRLQVQQSVVFNLIAQEDNRTTIQLSDEMRRIAIKTKRDGSIMKTIAFLGAFFVPATFVSTLFAMPLFNWSAPTTSEIITNHFWIYGAVTGPLTILTMAIVGYWILSRAQKNLDDKDSSSDSKSSYEARPSRFENLKEKLRLKKREPFETKDGV